MSRAFDSPGKSAWAISAFGLPDLFERDRVSVS
jgi:hypothetical protein